MKKNKKNKVFIILIIFISIGFAYLSATLNLNGTVGFNANTFDVHFDNIEIVSEDVTYTKAKANYEFVADRKKAPVLDTTSISKMFKYTGEAPAYNYKKTYYLSGGMAMHLLIQKGKYKIIVYTPKDHASFFPTTNKDDWISNVFEYDTENPTKVIFVSPTVNDNGFYNGGWHIGYKAPQFWKVTKGTETE